MKHLIILPYIPLIDIKDDCRKELWTSFLKTKDFDYWHTITHEEIKSEAYPNRRYSFIYYAIKLRENYNNELEIVENIIKNLPTDDYMGLVLLHTGNKSPKFNDHLQTFQRGKINYKTFSGGGTAIYSKLIKVTGQLFPSLEDKAGEDLKNELVKIYDSVWNYFVYNDIYKKDFNSSY